MHRPSAHAFARSIIANVAALVIICPPAGAQSVDRGPIVNGPLGRTLDSTMKALEARGYSGVVRVDKEGATVLEHGYGMANRADHIPFAPSTVVQIGSNTKDFTAVAILQLANRGRLRVSDSIGKYFANVPVDKRGITIAELLDHRAGLPIGLGSDFEAVTRQQLVDAAMKVPLDYAPGANQAYSNLGFSVLAAIIEQVSGQTYDQYLRDHILAPLGLHDTGFTLPGFVASRVAHGYRGTEDMGTMLSHPHATDGPYWNLRGNGGLLSTVDDMHAFYAALFGNDVLLPRAVARQRFNPDEPIGLAGSDLISSFLYERLPGARIEFVIASNSAEFSERAVRDQLAPILGLPTMGVARAQSGAPARPDAHAPAAQTAATISAFVRAVNSGDSSVIARFITDHFAPDTAAPPPAARAQRLTQMHGDLGELTIRWMDEVQSGMIDVSLASPREGSVMLKVRVDPKRPDRLQGIGIMVGG